MRTQCYLRSVVPDGKLDHGDAGAVAVRDPLHRAGVDLQVGADLRALDEVLRLQVLHFLQLPVGQLDDGAFHEVGRQRGGRGGGSSGTSGKGLAADARCSANPTSTTLPAGFMLGDLTPSSLFGLVESGLSVT